MSHSAADRRLATHAVIRHRRQLAALAVQRADHEWRRATDAAAAATAAASAAVSDSAHGSGSGSGSGTASDSGIVDPVGALHAAQTRVALAQSALEAARNEQERVIRATTSATPSSSSSSSTAHDSADENTSPLADTLSDAAQSDLIRYAQHIVAEARAEHALTSLETSTSSAAERQAAHDMLLHAVQRLKLTRKEVGLVRVKQLLAAAAANEALAKRKVAAAQTNEQRAVAEEELKAATQARRKAKVASSAVSGKYMIQVRTLEWNDRSSIL